MSTLPNSPPRVAVCVLTGFLGSGKTTLLRGLLGRAPERDRIAVIVNEIGEIGVDGRVLTGFEFVESVVELASGCVCCTIDEYRFDMAVEELVRRVNPTLLVLETTGVADPLPTLDRLRRCGLGVDSVVTVVDARAWAKAWRMSGAMRRQVEAADFLVLSKTDLVDARARQRVRAKLAKANPRALLLEGAGGEAFPGEELVLATTAARTGRLTSRPEEASNHLREERVDSFSWCTTSAVDRFALERCLNALPREVFRAKGFLREQGQAGGWLVQLVCGRVEVTAAPGGGRLAAGAQVVFIGRDLERQRAQIERCLAACVLALAGAALSAEPEAASDQRSAPRSG